MIIYHDLLTGDEVCADTFPIKMLYDGAIMEVKGETKTESHGIDSSLIGGNASAEAVEGDEGVEDGSTTGINVVINHDLNESCFDKKSFLKHTGKYCKKILTEIKDETEKDKFKAQSEAFVKKVVKEFKEYRFFIGKKAFEEGEEGMVILLKYDEETPYFYFFKHGLEEEKV